MTSCEEEMIYKSSRWYLSTHWNNNLGSQMSRSQDSETAVYSKEVVDAEGRRNTV